MKNNQSGKTSSSTNEVDSLQLDLCKKYFPALEWEAFDYYSEQIYIGGNEINISVIPDHRINASLYWNGKQVLGIDSFGKDSSTLLKEALEKLRKECDRLIAALAKEV